MSELFFKLLSMSCTASIIVLAVIMMRIVFKKAPKWFICLLWIMVLIRLICPFSLESSISVIPKQDYSYESIVFNQSTENKNPAVKPENTHSTENFESPALSDKVTVNTPTTTSPNITLSLIWGFGVLCMLSYMLISYLKLCRIVKESEPTGNGIYICDRISISFILGIFRPKIYISSAMQKDEATYIISHEKSHIKRFDHLWKPLGFILLSIYWFNPMLWIAYILLCRDIELACDEKVIKQMDIEYKMAYATMLLKSSAPHKFISACPLAFGGNGVKNRINSVLTYTPPSRRLVALSTVISVLAAICLLTDPVTAIEEIVTIPNFEQTDVSIPQENEPINISDKKYEFNGNNILLLNAENKSNENYSVTILVKYYDENGNFIKKDVDTFSGLAAKSSQYFLFQPEIKFDSYSYNVYTENYDGYCLSKDISVSVDSFMLFNDRIMNFYSTSCNLYINTPLQTDVNFDFSVVIFDTKGNVVDIFPICCKSSQFEPGDHQSLCKRIDKDTFLTQAGSYIYTLVDYVDFYEWNNIDNAICVINNISE